MSSLNDERDRTVVPRWRLFPRTRKRGELSSLYPPKLPAADIDLSEQLAEWNEHRTTSIACDLVSVAFTHRQFDIASDAAEFLAKDIRTPSTARALAIAYLAGKTVQLDREAFFGESLNIAKVRNRIHQLRCLLKEYPSDPIGWTDLALLYTTIGRPDKASRAMTIALNLAPTNRHVLRSAARMLQHSGNIEAAHHLLTRSQMVMADPWIAAAEVALATANGKISQHFKQFRRWLLDERFSPRHSSELASAVATVYSLQHDSKLARKFIRSSLINPSENAVAQALWLAQRYPAVAVTESPPLVSFEGNAWRTTQKREWTQSLSWAQRWLADQPFSSRPAVHASFVASEALEEYEISAEIARQGLIPNPDDTTLHNNLAFALAQLDQPDDAEKALDNIPRKPLNPSSQIVVTATRGLIAFRRGRVMEGEHLYHQAIRLAQERRDPRALVAEIYLAMEQLRAGVGDGQSRRLRLISAKPSPAIPTTETLLERLKRMA